MPTVLAGALLVAVGVVVTILRLADSTDGPTAAVIVLVFGAVLIVSGALALLAGRLRERGQHP